MSAMLVQGGRTVATWRPNGWPAGAITGYVDDDQTFHVEHVIVFNGSEPNALHTMLREGIEKAWEMGCNRITWYVPHAFRGAVALRRVGHELGFKETHRDETMAYFSRAR